LFYSLFTLAGMDGNKGIFHWPQPTQPNQTSMNGSPG